MGRGKIEIKRIENTTNRQVTYSKRRGGITKKAQELSVLCDAEVSLIMFSSTGKFHEYISPTTTTKKIFDRYQQISRIDLWQPHYEKMQNNLNKLKEVNNNLRREIRQRMGEDLNDLSIEELRGLEQNLDDSLDIVREQKYHKIQTQTDTCKKKLKNSQETHRELLRHFEVRDEDLDYGLGDNEEDYESELGVANVGSHSLAYRLQPTQLNIQDGGIYGFRDLRLA
uniref:APETALA3 n=1 Tax=Platanus acerifolia TaxID=140101 RepID=A4UTT8_PLAAC|nr:APETALA3 [Platanus x hispanica]